MILPDLEMSEGSSLVVQLAVTIDRRQGTAVFDFAGTGPEVHGNTNAPPAVTYSAIIYALRCMVHQDIPLNQVGLTLHCSFSIVSLPATREY